jgi:hypothetical protein
LGVFASTGGISAVTGVLVSEIQRIVEIGFIAALMLYLEVEYPMHERNRREVNVLAALLIGFWIAAVAIGHFVFAIATLVLGLPFALRRISGALRVSEATSLRRGVRMTTWVLKLPRPPDSTPPRVKSWFALLRKRTEVRRGKLQRRAGVLDALNDDARAALADRNLTVARDAIPPEVEISDEELQDLVEEMSPDEKTFALNRRIRAVLMIFIVLFAINMALADRPWNPPERIVVEGADPRSGFVVDEAVDHLVVLWDSPRKIERISTERILDREICTDSAQPRFPTLPELISGEHDEPDYQECPPR